MHYAYFLFDPPELAKHILDLTQVRQTASEILFVINRSLCHTEFGERRREYVCVYLLYGLREGHLLFCLGDLSGLLE